jgi:multisubunit Na+/H+ antiporter MnhF subunit
MFSLGEGFRYVNMLPVYYPFVISPSVFSNVYAFDKISVYICIVLLSDCWCQLNGQQQCTGAKSSTLYN